MGRRQPTRRVVALRLLPLTAACLLATLARAQEAAPTQSDFGGTGLWQTPTARMAPEGEASFTASRTSPYTRWNFSLQPLPWLEGSFRYINIGNRRYGPADLSGKQHYKDKSIDLKLRLWHESHWLPTVAVGIRDLGGTGLFSGEYVVANKRFGPLDASLGLAWGYLGARGDLPNPFDLVSDRFRTRPSGTLGSGGEFSSNRYFRGRTALFGGVSYQTPWQPLVLKLEYEGNNYQHEPQSDNQPQRTAFNVGAVYRLNANVDLSLALERGRVGMFGFTLHGNLGQARSVPKLLDPPPPPRKPAPADTQANQVDWAATSAALRANAGLAVTRITRRGRELVVTGEPTRYFNLAQTVGRTARVLDNRLGNGIDWYTVEASRDGLAVVDTSVHRQRFDELLTHDLSLDDFRRSVEQDVPLPRREEVLYQAKPARFDGDLSPGYAQTLGGPNGFILYQLYAAYDADFHFTPNLWWSGNLHANLLNNYSHFTYDAPSNLPRVRTYVREYLTSSRLTMPVFQLTATRRLGSDLYGMAYGGLLESMYGGAGGEVLYRPLDQHWALGVDANWVRQRGFDQDFAFRRYHVATGHITSYLELGSPQLLLQVSYGRYLAGDVGTTIDLSRVFRNGVRMGAWATFTNVSAKQFGEGSFDKGIYISIPFDLMLLSSHQSSANVVWQPLLRDGGARLSRRYTLYDLTSERDGRAFQDGLNTISQ